MQNVKAVAASVFFFTLACERVFIETHSIESRCYRPEKWTVCRRVCVSFSPDILQVGAMKGLNRTACTDQCKFGDRAPAIPLFLKRWEGQARGYLTRIKWWESRSVDILTDECSANRRLLSFFFSTLFACQITVCFSVLTIRKGSTLKNFMLFLVIFSCCCPFFKFFF